MVTPLTVISRLKGALTYTIYSPHFFLRVGGTVYYMIQLVRMLAEAHLPVPKGHEVARNARLTKFYANTGLHPLSFEHWVTAMIKLVPKEVNDLVLWPDELRNDRVRVSLSKGICLDCQRDTCFAEAMVEETPDGAVVRCFICAHGRDKQQFIRHPFRAHEEGSTRSILLECAAIFALAATDFH